MQGQFHDRYEAGGCLATRLAAYADRSDVIVLALPRGGVPVGFAVAQALHVPLDVLVVRKRGVPGHEELAMGAIAADVLVLNDEIVAELGISHHTLAAIAAKEQFELVRRERAYRGERPAAQVAGRTAILVDDGLATGTTMRAAIAVLRRHAPAQIVVAVPVIALESCGELQEQVDALVWVLAPEPFYAVGLWYADFAPTTDTEVRDLLAHAAEQAPRQAAIVQARRSPVQSGPRIRGSRPRHRRARRPRTATH